LDGESGGELGVWLVGEFYLVRVRQELDEEGLGARLVLGCLGWQRLKVAL